MSSLISHRIAWDFDAHKAAGKYGGDDFLTRFGEDVEAPVSGWLTMTGTTASIRQADGWRTVLLELGTLVGNHSRSVNVGDVIAKAGKLWVHAHDLAPADPPTKHTRCRWITGHLTPSGDNGTPIAHPEPRRSNTMATLFHLEGSNPTRYALAGDSPGTPANWHETTTLSLATAWSAQIGGPSAGINQATWDLYKNDYLAPLTIATTGTSTVTNVTLTPAELDKIAEAVNNNAAARLIA